MHYLVFRITNDWNRTYIWSNQYSFENHYLLTLVSIFNDGSSSIYYTLLEQLVSGNGTGFGGNSVYIDIKNNDVLIGSIFDDDPEEHGIHIDRFVLIEIINKWIALRNSRICEIAFIQYDNGKINLKNRLDCPKLYDIDIDGALLNNAQHKFVIFCNLGKNGVYSIQRDNNPRLSTLANLFNRSQGELQALQNQLLSKEQFINAYLKVAVSDKEVSIEPTDISNSVDYKITLPIEQLLSVIEQWQQLAKNNPKYLILFQHDDGNIEVKDFSNSNYKLWYF